MKNNIILKAENISKQYRLGLVGTGTMSHDLNRWWHKVRGKEDPYLKIGAENDRSKKAETDYVWALRDINFDVYDGDVLGIIGKNGAGKSTLLKILSRVTTPTTGSIKTKGRIASLLEVGTGFHPELTGRENIYLNGAILGMTKSEIKAKEEEIIDFSGCAMYIDTPVKRYSSGMRVRLAFAVAAHLEPDILVVDEVLAVGDAEFQKKAIGKMKDISGNDGRTVLFVSHDMAAIQNLCKRLIVLKNGTVDFEGYVEAGVDYYLKGEENTINSVFTDYNVQTGIQKVTFLNLNNEPIDNIVVGQEVLIEVKYNNVNKYELSFTIAFTDTNGVFKFGCRSDIVNQRFNDYKGKVILKIPKWPLSEGVYNYNVLSHNRGQQEQFIKEAGSINVFKGDFYGTGKLPGRKKSFYVDYSWNETN